MIARATVAALCALFAAVPQVRVESAPPSDRTTTYVSTNLDSVIVFKGDHVRFGPNLALSDVAWPASHAEYLQPSAGIDCVSMGPSATSEEFAVKRPIKLGERYRCKSTAFAVIKCYANCRAAVVQVEKPLANGRPGLKSYLYIDDCLGVVAYSQVRSFYSGIPNDAPVLRGDVGVLASKDYPGCRF
jgi:hypothetical protein